MRIPKKQFAMLFGDMWNRVNPDIIKNGFRKGGICPFDKTVIPKEKYNPPALQDGRVFKEIEEIEQPHQNPSGSFQNLQLETVKQSNSETRKPRKRIATGAEVITSMECIQRRAEIDNSKKPKKKKPEK